MRGAKEILKEIDNLIPYNNSFPDFPESKKDREMVLDGFLRCFVKMLLTTKNVVTDYLSFNKPGPNETLLVVMSFTLEDVYNLAIVFQKLNTFSKVFSASDFSILFKEATILNEQKHIILDAILDRKEEFLFQTKRVQPFALCILVIRVNEGVMVRPFVLCNPNHKNSMYCTTCKTIAPKLSLCGKCQLYAYCNDTCQRAHWPAHREACKK